MNKMINSFNESIEKIILLLEIKREQNKFVEMLWIYFVNETKEELKEYIKFKDGRSKAIDNINKNYKFK